MPKKQVGISANHRQVTLLDGDIGVIIKPNGHIDLLAPQGTSHLSTLHQALAGAAIGVTMDQDYLQQALGTFNLYFTPPPAVGAN